MYILIQDSKIINVHTISSFVSQLNGGNPLGSLRLGIVVTSSSNAICEIKTNT
jgi:hypothetical protein